MQSAKKPSLCALLSFLIACKQSQAQKGEKKKLSIASQAIKTHKLVILRNHGCASIHFNQAGNKGGGGGA